MTVLLGAVTSLGGTGAEIYHPSPKPLVDLRLAGARAASGQLQGLGGWVGKPSHFGEWCRSDESNS